MLLLLPSCHPATRSQQCVSKPINLLAIFKLHKKENPKPPQKEEEKLTG